MLLWIRLLLLPLLDFGDSDYSEAIIGFELGQRRLDCFIDR